MASSMTSDLSSRFSSWLRTHLTTFLLSSTILTSEKQRTDDEDEQQNMTTENPINVNIIEIIEEVEESEETPLTITITSDIFQQNEEIEYIPIEFSEEILCEPQIVFNIKDFEVSCENPNIADKCNIQNENESLEIEEKPHLCLICGSNNTSNTEFSREQWIENEKWRNECAETICDLFFSTEFHSFNEFFQIAYYCTSCQKLIWEADYTRRLIMSLQKTIDKLSITLRKRFAFNYIQLNTSQEHTNDFPSSPKVFEFPGNLSFNDVVHQIYSENISAFDLEINEAKYVPLQTEPNNPTINTYTKKRRSKKRRKKWTKLKGDWRTTPAQKKGITISTPNIKIEKELSADTEVEKDFCNLEGRITKHECPNKKDIYYHDSQEDHINDIESRCQRRRGRPIILHNTSSDSNTNHDFLENNGANSISEPVIETENQLPTFTEVVLDYNNLADIKVKPARPRKQIFNIERKDKEMLNDTSTEDCDFQTSGNRSQSDNFEVEAQENSPELKPKLDLEGNILNSNGKIKRQRKQPQRFINEDMSSKGLGKNKRKVEKANTTPKVHSDYWKRRWLHQQNMREKHNLMRRLKRSKHWKYQSCPVVGCNFKYIKNFTLRQHVKIEHKGMQVDEALFHCQVDGCGMKYSRKDSLTHHIKTVHEGIKDPYITYNCKFCSKKFPTMRALQRHQFIHPEIKIATDDPKYFKPIYDFTCEICDQGYLKEEDLVSHMEIHSGPNPFVCSHCNEQFTNRTAVVAHIRIEHDLETPTCEFCGKSFTNGRRLQEHRNIHLDPDECFKCLECDYYTPNKRTLSNHVNRHHREPTTVQCETCGKTFNSPLYLRYHKRSHNTEKRYKCRVCEKWFKHWSSRKDHEEMHSGLRMHICTFCGKVMRTRSILRNHERIHTRDPNVPLPKKPRYKSKTKTKWKSKKSPFNMPHIVDCIKIVASGNATQNNESSST